jgi:hypothetical protein
VSIVTLSHRPPSDRSLDTPRRRPEPPTPDRKPDGIRPVAPPAWSYGAGAVQRAVAQLWPCHPAAALDPLELPLHAVDRDAGLDDVY